MKKQVKTAVVFACMILFTAVSGYYKPKKAVAAQDWDNFYESAYSLSPEKDTDLAVVSEDITLDFTDFKYGANDFYLYGVNSFLIRVTADYIIDSPSQQSARFGLFMRSNIETVKTGSKDLDDSALHITVNGEVADYDLYILPREERQSEYSYLDIDEKNYYKYDDNFNAEEFIEIDNENGYGWTDEILSRNRNMAAVFEEELSLGQNRITLKYLIHGKNRSDYIGKTVEYGYSFKPAKEWSGYGDLTLTFKLKNTLKYLYKCNLDIEAADTVEDGYFNIYTYSGGLPEGDLSFIASSLDSLTRNCGTSGCAIVWTGANCSGSSAGVVGAALLAALVFLLRKK